MTTNTELVRFVIVDDDEVNTMAIQRTMAKLQLVNPAIVARDGVEALAILRGLGDAEKRPPPYIITLDLSMPRMDGLELLDEIRKDPVLCKAVVFVLSKSDDPENIAAAYKRNIAGYIVNNGSASAYADALSMINRYAGLIVLPSQTATSNRVAEKSESQPH